MTDELYWLTLTALMTAIFLAAIYPQSLKRNGYRTSGF